MMYATLVSDTAVKCNGKPYITPGDPTKSWLIDVLTQNDPGCDTDQMPQNLTPLSASDLKEVEDWITQGALKDATSKSLVSPLAGGLDAGL